jgi:hypothetical protein
VCSTKCINGKINQCCVSISGKNLPASPMASILKITRWMMFCIRYPVSFPQRPFTSDEVTIMAYDRGNILWIRLCDPNPSDSLSITSRTVSFNLVLYAVKTVVIIVTTMKSLTLYLSLRIKGRKSSPHLSRIPALSLGMAMNVINTAKRR